VNDSDNLHHRYAPEELTALHQRLQVSKHPPSLLARFHDLLLQFHATVMTMQFTERARISQQSSTRATANSFRTYNRRIDDIWRMLDDSFETMSERAAQRINLRNQQIEFFVFEVTKLWMVLNEGAIIADPKKCPACPKLPNKFRHFTKILHSQKSILHRIFQLELGILLGTTQNWESFWASFKWVGEDVSIVKCQLWYCNILKRILSVAHYVSVDACSQRDHFPVFFLKPKPLVKIPESRDDLKHLECANCNHIVFRAFSSAGYRAI
jgi:hypothetical protein